VTRVEIVRALCPARIAVFTDKKLGKKKKEEKQTNTSARNAKRAIVVLSVLLVWRSGDHCVSVKSRRPYGVIARVRNYSRRATCVFRDDDDDDKVDNNAGRGRPGGGGGGGGNAVSKSVSSRHVV